MSGPGRIGRHVEFTARPAARWQRLIRWVIDAVIRHGHARRQAREAKHFLASCQGKLTDEAERKMMERITRDKNFRPGLDG